MQLTMEPPKKKKIQDYLPDGWPEIIQSEAKLAGLRKGVSIPTIKRVVYGERITHKLWPFIWAHVQKGKERETQLNQVLNPAA